VTERSDDAALSDAALLERHAAGDPEAFGELFRRHRDRLWAVALRTVGDREEAADAVQDAFISAMRASAPTAGGTGKPAGASAAAFRGDSAVTTWLHRIVVNACLDRLRRRAVRPTDPLPVTEPRSPAPDAFAAADASFDVVAALDTLPLEQRTALVLVDMYGWSIEDTAQVLDCAPGTVKSRCARGRARLLPLLREDDGNRLAPGRVPPPSAAHHDALHDGPRHGRTAGEGGEPT
jgi:RNA polymerase sigma-70 factor (ECF subfamily)